MKTRDQILRDMRAGRMDECAAEVLRYGVIQQEAKWAEDNADSRGRLGMRSEFHSCIVHHLGWEWTLETENGICKKLGGKPY